MVKSETIVGSEFFKSCSSPKAAVDIKMLIKEIFHWVNNTSLSLSSLVSLHSILPGLPL